MLFFKLFEKRLNKKKRKSMLENNLILLKWFQVNLILKLVLFVFYDVTIEILLYSEVM